MLLRRNSVWSTNIIEQENAVFSSSNTSNDISYIPIGKQSDGIDGNTDTAGEAVRYYI